MTDNSHFGYEFASIVTSTPGGRPSMSVWGYLGGDVRLHRTRQSVFWLVGDFCKGKKYFVRTLALIFKPNLWMACIFTSFTFLDSPPSPHDLTQDRSSSTTSAWIVFFSCLTGSFFLLSFLLFFVFLFYVFFSFHLIVYFLVFFVIYIFSFVFLCWVIKSTCFWIWSKLIVHFNKSTK